MSSFLMAGISCFDCYQAAVEKKSEAARDFQKDALNALSNVAEEYMMVCEGLQMITFENMQEMVDFADVLKLKCYTCAHKNAIIHDSVHESLIAPALSMLQEEQANIQAREGIKKKGNLIKAHGRFAMLARLKKIAKGGE